MRKMEYPFPVFGTQGGGLVRLLDNDYIFVEAPDGVGLSVGDVMPEEWGLVPANEMAERLFDESLSADPQIAGLQMEIDALKSMIPV